MTICEQVGETGQGSDDGAEFFRSQGSDWHAKVGETTTTAFTNANSATLRERPVNKLSGGELQRMAIALICIAEADIYMFGEPATQCGPGI